MFVQPEPLSRCHCHWKLAGEPVHVPAVPVSVWPRVPVPDTEGAAVTPGAGPATTSWPTEVAWNTYWLTNDHDSVAKPLSPHPAPHWFSIRRPVAS